MKPYIEYIGVIDNKNKVHAVHFKQGLNIVTGKSSTGKSALIEIFDYCFGSADYTVPVGKITKHTSLYFIVLKFQTHSTVIARKPDESKGFIKEVEEIKKIGSTPYFSSDFFEIDRFIRLDIFKKELGTLFGLDITDTDTNLETVKYRRQKSPAPSIRSFTSFMLQHQNLIANKHAIFYRFDQKEKKDQAIEHFKILLGYADQDFFLLSQKLNELETEQR